MEITEWFDINNIEHLRAFQTLRHEGYWPTGFIPEGMIFTEGWMRLINSDIVDAWLYYKVDDNE